MSEPQPYPPGTSVWVADFNPHRPKLEKPFRGKILAIDEDEEAYLISKNGKEYGAISFYETFKRQEDAEYEYLLQFEEYVDNLEAELDRITFIFYNEVEVNFKKNQATR